MSTNFWVIPMVMLGLALLSAFVNINLDKDTVGVCVRHLHEFRADALARAAPSCCEVDAYELEPQRARNARQHRVRSACKWQAASTAHGNGAPGRWQTYLAARAGDCCVEFCLSRNLLDHAEAGRGYASEVK